MGGELFNPGSVEMRKLSELTGISAARVIGRSAQLNLLACDGRYGYLLALERAPARGTILARPRHQARGRSRKPACLNPCKST